MPAGVRLEPLSACRTLALNRLKFSCHPSAGLSFPGAQDLPKCPRQGLRPGLQSVLAPGGLSSSPSKKTVLTKPLAHGQGWDECTALPEGFSGGIGCGFIGRLCK